MLSTLRSVRRFRVALAASLLAIVVPAADAADDGWRYSVTPYLWLPSIDGTLRYGRPPGGSGSPSVGVDSSSLLEALDFAAMVRGEARQDRFSVSGDFIYLALSTDDSRIRSVDRGNGLGSNIGVSASLERGTETEVDGWMLTLLGGYSLFDRDGTSLDAIAGMRYFHIEATTKFRLGATVTGPRGETLLGRSGSLSADSDLFDVLVGLKGRIALGEGNWSLPYYVDVGTGSSDLTAQFSGGVAYAFEKFDLTLAYRHLYYDQEEGKLLQDFSFSGPLLAVGFRF